MSTEHTPTPWHMTGRPNALGTYTVFFGHGETIANQICQTPRKADAEFICKASEACKLHDDLVEALENAKNFIETGSITREGNSSLDILGGTEGETMVAGIDMILARAKETT